MSFKQEKENRLNYLREIYRAAKESNPTYPTSAVFGLSKYNKFNFQTKQIMNNDEEKGGYIIGQKLGLSQQDVDSIVNYYSDDELGYLNFYTGGGFTITQRGIMYLENLEEEPFEPIQIHHNQINVGDINAPVQFQQNSNHSSQTQTTTYSKQDIKELFTALKADIEKLNPEQQEDLKTEIEYAEKQLVKGKDIKAQLSAIGQIIKEVGFHVFAHLIASPIFEVIKPHLGL